MDDHDQRFKTLLREVFPEFFQLFLLGWADRFDFARVEWIDKEVFADPSQGERRALDLVAKLATKEAVPAPRPGQEVGWLVLIHVEIESADTAAPFRPRMFDYYQGLRRRYGLSVLPVGLYLRVGLAGIGWDVYEERLWERTLLRFEYAYLGLPAWDATQFVEGDNPLGVALTSLMRRPRERRSPESHETLNRP